MPERLGAHLTREAKQALAAMIRGLRQLLLTAIHDEADRRYRLSIPIGEAGLDEAHRRRRERIEAWVDERARATKPKNKAELRTTKERLLAQAEKEAAATLVNRLVLIRHLEALGLSKPAVLTGGWSSKGYREFREFAPTLCSNGTTDPTEGYDALLQFLFDELAVDLPGLFGDVGLTRLFWIPAATLREVVEQLDGPVLSSAWTDDTTLGWVYQYWNDPDREALDAKINAGGKIEPHEIASKTQMFTERYMVEWLLQNSLGLTWLAMCTKHGWKPEADRVLPMLEERRAEWRKKREAGDVALDALMPIEGGLEQHWKYYVPQSLPDDAVEKAPESVRAIKLLDPACGSGHFLVIAFDLLVALYREEARHRGTSVTDKEIAESILENNLHGIDIDPRAIQLAAAGLYLKAKSLAANAGPNRVNLVAPILELGELPENDEALGWFTLTFAQEAGVPEELSRSLIRSLAGVDHLGSLFRVDEALARTIDEAERATDWVQQALPREFASSVGSVSEVGGAKLRAQAMYATSKTVALSDALEAFLSKHSRSDDLGLRLDGEQLAAGVRFVRLAREGAYDLVVGNPPYQALTKTSAFDYVGATYTRGKVDLYSAFMERALELARPSGVCAFVTMRGWMYLNQFRDLRTYLLHDASLAAVADLGTGAFSSRSMDDVISTALAVWRRALPSGPALAIQAGPLADPRRDAGKPARREAALVCQQVAHSFDARLFRSIEGEPIVYWWTPKFLAEYSAAPKLGARHPIRYGLSTQNNVRWLRRPWEVRRSHIMLKAFDEPPGWDGRPWVAYIKGSEGKAWCDELGDVVLWRHKGLELATYPENRFGRGTTFYYRRGVAFANIGTTFSARAHTRQSIFGHVAGSVFAEDTAGVVCLLNSRKARFVMESLNPGLHFLTTDVERLPVFEIADCARIFEHVESAFVLHEAAREPSVAFRAPGPSPWRSAQAWAQQAVDRDDGSPLPKYAPVYESATPMAFISFAFGVAIGRFDAHGNGVIEIEGPRALPQGILFVAAGADDLDSPASDPIPRSWKEYGDVIGEGDDLRTFLRKSFFDFHKKLYENRPIYFPLSSAKKNFVAFVSIHRWADHTMQVLLADRLVPTKRRLEGELDDLRTAKATGSSTGKAEKRFTEVQKLLEELDDFIAKVTEIAERGPPPPDGKTTKREVDAPFRIDLDDGVMVNSAALWPLLEPQWKDPKKWWKELANAQGKKDYDWSHLAARYFPSRVRKKCHDDPSLAVAHKCFWELHPAKAYAWELRLQDEIGPKFKIDESGSDQARATFLNDHDQEAREILAKELKRREKKTSKEEETEAGPLFSQGEEEEDSDD